jgi:hypothetical protein
MPKFAVTVEGKKYQVEAPDGDTAWAWANDSHRAAPATAPAPSAPGALQKESAMKVALAPSAADDAAYAKHMAMFGVTPTGADGSPTPPAVSGQTPPAAPIPQPPSTLSKPPRQPINLQPTLAEGVNASGNFMDRAIAGVGTAVTSPYVGLKQALGLAKPEELEEQKALTDSGAGKLGNIVGNLVALGIPVAKATQLATKAYATFLPRAAASVAAVPTVAGIEGAAQPVQEGETRGGNAAFSAGAGSLLQGGGNLFRRALTQPVRPTQEAADLMKLGIQPTVKQGGTGVMGGVVGGAQDIAGVTPLGPSGMVARGRDRVQQEIGDVAGVRAHPDIPHTIERVERGPYAENMMKDIADARSAVLAGKSIPVPGVMKSRALANAEAALPMSKENVKKDVLDDIEAILPKHKGRISGETWHEMETRITERIQKHSGPNATGDDADKVRAYQAVKDQLGKIRDAGMSKDDVARLNKIGSAEEHSVILNDALKQTEGGIGDRLIKSVKNLTPEATFNAKKGLYQDITEPATTVLARDKDAKSSFISRAGYALAGLGLGMGGGALVSPAALLAAPVAVGLGTAASTRRGAKALMGGYGWQQDVANRLRAMNPGMAATIGGTTEER